MPAIQVPVSPQDDPMQFISGGITPADPARPVSSTGMHLRTEEFDPLEDQDNGWGVPNAVAAEL